MSKKKNAPSPQPATVAEDRSSERPTDGPARNEAEPRAAEAEHRSAPAPSSVPPPPSDERLDRRLGWGLFVAGFASLFFTEKSAGFVRDESVYFDAAESYARWFQTLMQSPSTALSDDVIVRLWSNNHEHPALMKSLFGLSFLLFHEGLGLLRPAAAFRVPAFAMAALLLPLTFAFVKPLFGRAAAVFAAVSFLFVPRQFFEAHLACFDVPIAALWLLVVYCFWQAQTRPRYWLYTGLAFGAALATKHNAFFLPVVLIPFSLWRGWLASSEHATARSLFVWVNGSFIAAVGLYGLLVFVQGPEGFQRNFLFLSPHLAIYLVTMAVGAALVWQLKRTHEATFRAVAPLVAMAGLGPLIFYVTWPYLWHHPVDRTAWYLAFHATHNHYAWFYLGTVLRAPPFPLEYVLVKTALTVPTSLFVPMVLGVVWVLVRVLRREVTWVDLLITANAAASIALISLPSVPHFGGVKHWFPSMPFLAMLAAGALARGAEALRQLVCERWPKLTDGANAKFTSPRTVFAALATLVLLPALIATVRVYPYGTSAYSELAGGLPGAATLGMQRQFWANNVTGVLGYINANARPGERVYLHENHGGQIRDYQRNDMLRKDLNFVASPFEADLVAYQYHQEFREHEFNTWQSLGTTKPVFGLYVDETPQVVVYRRTH